jgi:hypothetical protein
LFKPIFPAAAGEFVLALSSDMYWKDLPVLTKLPSVIEIVMALVGDRVS